MKQFKVCVILVGSDAYGSSILPHTQLSVHCHCLSFMLHCCVVVRPRPPFNISVKHTDSYKITWDNKNPRLCLTYRVRLRPSPSPSPARLALTLNSTQSFVHLPQSRLHPGVCYRVDIQARLCPGSLYRGPWSEWSTPSSCISAAITSSPQAEGTNGYYWLITLPILMVLLSLAFSKRVFGQKRLQLMTYNPDPSEFFKPLYNSYEGNFKAWVMPVFTEQDFTVDSVGDMKLDQWNQCYFLQSSPPPYHPAQSPSPSRSPSQSRGSSQVSIHTVTLCGSLGYPGEASCEEPAEGTEAEGRQKESLEELSLSSQDMGQDEEGLLGDGYPHMELDEEGLSGDRYPHMDMDTIDSGFGECSSPPTSGPSVEQLCELYQSNYVKQWTIDHCEVDLDLCTPPQAWR